VESCNISKLNADNKYRETVTRTEATSQEVIFLSGLALIYTEGYSRKNVGEIGRHLNN